MKHVFRQAGVALVLTLIGFTLIRRGLHTAPPHILFITIDTLRRDHVGVYGAPWPITPHIDRWAARGTVFLRVYATAAWTPPAMASLLYGGTPAQHGVTDWHTPPVSRSISWPKWLAERYRYRTVFFTNHPGLAAPELRFRDQFREWHFYGRPFQSAERLTDRVIAWARKHNWKTPTLLWIHFLDPHEPFQPPPPWGDYWLQNTVPRPLLPHPAPLCAPEEMFGWNCIPPYVLKYTIDATAYHPERIRALYRADVAYTDAQVGRLIEWIMRWAAGYRWIVSITADHGEIMETTHPIDPNVQVYFSHGTLLTDDLIRIPWILYDTAGTVAGERVDMLVSQPDIPATVLALAGLQPPPDWAGYTVWRNGTWQSTRTWVTAWELRIPAAVITDGNWKLWVMPTETVVLRRGDVRVRQRAPQRLARLVPRVQQWLYLRRTDLRTATPLPEDLQRELRQIGYVGP